MMHESATPLMKQYYQVKQQYADMLVFFQVGDFYELFFDDAKVAAAFLGIALTKRGKNNGEPIPLCGVPVHALDHYLTKLIRGGFKVALCDQLEEPKPGKVVERGITRVFTPGTLTESTLLDAKSASYLCSFFPLPDAWGLLFAELLTAQLYATVLPPAGERILESEINRFVPDEILIPATPAGKSFQTYFKQIGYFTSIVAFDEQNEQQRLPVDSWLQQFKTDTHSVIDTHVSLKCALYHFYHYLQATHAASLQQFNQLQFYQADDFLLLDAATQRNLELVKNQHDGGRSGTLLSVVDDAMTGMGSRMIKKWVLRPLIKQDAIVERQDVVQLLMGDYLLMQQLKQQLSAIGDIERVVGRIALRRAQLNDYLMLVHALDILPRMRSLLSNQKLPSLLKTIMVHLIDFSPLQDLLSRSLNSDLDKDWIIKQGFDARLDAIRELVHSGNQKILELEKKEQQLTGITSLKIRYNQVHGYSIEITKTHYDAIPAHYIRRQTLVGRERFTTPELQELEHAIAQAQVEIVSVEKEIFESIKSVVANQVTQLRKTAHALAHMDALLSFASIAYHHGYTRPLLATNHDIIINGGRHPVIERTLGNRFIPNDTYLTDEQMVWIITGPNMGGKSTYQRQVALISLMAHCGSFVPAKQAAIPMLDRIFTRIGAGDNLVGGKSTFMVEMEETAAICTQATEHSLVILDEVGRGTSTFDGLAIAQAVVEHIYTTIKARCLFATHYHELTQLAHNHPGIVSYYAASTKTPEGIIFLYKMVAGVADGSFGVEVAKLAALPTSIINRAETILRGLDNQAAPFIPAQITHDPTLINQIAQLQAQLGAQEQMLALFKTLDYDNLSPKQAFDLIWQIKNNLQ